MKSKSLHGEGRRLSGRAVKGADVWRSLERSGNPCGWSDWLGPDSHPFTKGRDGESSQVSGMTGSNARFWVRSPNIGWESGTKSAKTIRSQSTNDLVGYALQGDSLRCDVKRLATKLQSEDLAKVMRSRSRGRRLVPVRTKRLYLIVG
jgi:hypothetical protein